MTCAWWPPPASTWPRRWPPASSTHACTTTDEGRLELPALRERPADILPLAEYFLGIYAQRLGLAIPQIGAAAQAALEDHPWHGNTRELENVVHFALLVSSGEEILPQHLNLPTPDLQRLIDRLDPAQRALLRAAGGVLNAAGSARLPLQFACEAFPLGAEPVAQIGDADFVA